MRLCYRSSLVPSPRLRSPPPLASVLCASLAWLPPPSSRRRVPLLRGLLLFFSRPGAPALPRALVAAWRACWVCACLCRLSLCVGLRFVGCPCPLPPPSPFRCRLLPPRVAWRFCWGVSRVVCFRWFFRFAWVSCGLTACASCGGLVAAPRRGRRRVCCWCRRGCPSCAAVCVGFSCVGRGRGRFSFSVGALGVSCGRRPASLFFCFSLGRLPAWGRAGSPLGFGSCAVRVVVVGCFGLGPWGVCRRVRCAPAVVVVASRRRCVRCVRLALPPVAVVGLVGGPAWGRFFSLAERPTGAEVAHSATSFFASCGGATRPDDISFPSADHPPATRFFCADI
jgi:hypothetical protein